MALQVGEGSERRDQLCPALNMEPSSREACHRILYMIREKMDMLLQCASSQFPSNGAKTQAVTLKIVRRAGLNSEKLALTTSAEAVVAARLLRFI